ncbi:MAG: hypothetical protein KBI46_11335 [Phycisphaerae bacterium]|nr:hypothetical protein [Phycisphaerae bacterium]
MHPIIKQFCINIAPKPQGYFKDSLTTIEQAQDLPDKVHASGGLFWLGCIDKKSNCA